MREVVGQDLGKKCIEYKRILKGSGIIWKNRNLRIMSINSNSPINSFIQYINLFFIFLICERRVYISAFLAGLHEK